VRVGGAQRITSCNGASTGWSSSAGDGSLAGADLLRHAWRRVTQGSGG
jgi:hypothetical protein